MTWHARQVSYLRAVADEDRRHRYLNGIEYVYGVEMRNSIEAEVERLGPAAVMRKLRESGYVHVDRPRKASALPQRNRYVFQGS